MRFVAVFVVALTALTGSLAGADQISVDSAVTLVERHTDDRILRAKPDTAPDGRIVYLVRLLREDGGMYTLEVDAESGGIQAVSTGPLVVPRGAPIVDEPESEPQKANAQDIDPCAS